MCIRDRYYTMYSINKEVFQCRILDILGEKSSDAQRQQEREARYRQRAVSYTHLAGAHGDQDLFGPQAHPHPPA